MRCFRESVLPWMYRSVKHLFIISFMAMLILFVFTFYTLNKNHNDPKSAFPSYDNPDTILGLRKASILTKTHHASQARTMTITPEAEFSRRRRMVENICTTTNKGSGSVHGVFTHRPSGVIYCFVPKTGCTFWKRVFNFVNNETLKNSIKSPFDISRLAVHSFSNSRGDQYNETRHGAHNYSIRYIITRDPISRMISTYLDKMYLPDFWKFTGVKFMELAQVLRHSRDRIQQRFQSSDIFRTYFGFKDRINTQINNKLNMSGNVLKKSSDDFMRKHFNEIAVMFNQSYVPNALSISDVISCGKYLTFADFVDASMYYPEPHWEPVSELCSPCSFLPTHIGYMETFTADARAILSQMGLEHLLDSFNNVEQGNEQLTSLTEYHFSHAFRSPFRNFSQTCLSALELAFRLWTSFQWQGYIHPLLHYKFPTFSDVDNVQADFMRQLWDARHKSLKYPETLKNTKSDFARKLIYTLSESALEDLMGMFNLDYLMFGYKKINRETCD